MTEWTRTIVHKKVNFDSITRPDWLVIYEMDIEGVKYRHSCACRGELDERILAYLDKQAEAAERLTRRKLGLRDEPFTVSMRNS